MLTICRGKYHLPHRRKAATPKSRSRLRGNDKTGAMGRSRSRLRGGDKTAGMTKNIRPYKVWV